MLRCHAARSYISLSAPGRKSLQKLPEATNFPTLLQWGCRALATGTQDNTRFENVILPLLRAFYELEGHCEVPTDYKVTAEHLAAADLTSSDCKIGFGLGKSLLNIETKGAYDIGMPEHVR